MIGYSGGVVIGEIIIEKASVKILKNNLKLIYLSDTSHPAVTYFLAIQKIGDGRMRCVKKNFI